MRNLRWPIAIFTVLVLLGAMLALRKPADPMRALAPYTKEEHTNYLSATQASAMLGKSSSPPMEYRYIEVHGISDKELEDVLLGYIAKEKGWSKPIGQKRGIFFFESHRGLAHLESIRTIRGSFARRVRYVLHAPMPDYFTIELGRPLGWWDIALLRIKGRGVNPFKN